MSEPIRVVLDTAITVSALLRPRGPAAPLRSRWRQRLFLPLLSPGTIRRIELVLKYPDFQLSAEQCDELLSDLVPFCEVLPEDCGGSPREVAKKGAAQWLITNSRPTPTSQPQAYMDLPLGTFLALLGVPMFETMEE